MANVSKNVRAAKKTFENITAIQDIVNENAVKAVEVLIKGMQDETASPASQQTCAKEILKLHWLFAQAAEKLLDDPKDREEERKQEVGKGVVAVFQRSPLSSV